MASIQSVANMKQVIISHHHVFAWDLKSPIASKPLKMCMQVISTRDISGAACPHSSATGHDVDMKYAFDNPGDLTEARAENPRVIISNIV
eukprot:8673355-Pyramimonas_sp.AAC.1